jgi:hypothetical protein
MKTFKDNKGREWPVTINTSALKRVRDELGVNLGNEITLHESWVKLRGDNLFVIEAAWSIIRPLAEPKNVTADDFADSMAGDAIGPCADAIMEGLQDFFRSPAIRHALQRVNAVAGKEIERQAAAMLQQLEASISGKPSTGSPESAASIPPNSPSES